MLDLKHIDQTHANTMEYLSDIPYNVNFRLEPNVKSTKRTIPFLDSIESIIHRMKRSFWLSHNKHNNKDSSVSSKRPKKNESSVHYKPPRHSSSILDFEKSSHDAIDIQEPLNIMEHLLTPNTLRNMRMQENSFLDKSTPLGNPNIRETPTLSYNIDCNDMYKIAVERKEATPKGDRNCSILKPALNIEEPKQAPKCKSFARIDQRVLKKLDLNKLDQTSRQSSLIRIDKPYKIDNPTNVYNDMVYTKPCTGMDETHHISGIAWPPVLSTTNLPIYYYTTVWGLYPQLYYPVVDH